MQRLRALLLPLVLAGCASGPAPSPSPSTVAESVVNAPAPTAPPVAAATPAPAPAASTPAEKRTAAASSLAVERQYLTALFKGTAVVITQRANGAVTVEVPREYCFDPGQDVIKPPLAKVIEKVAESMRRTPIAEMRSIAAPVDASGGAATLPTRRAMRIYESLKARGVPEARLTKPAAGNGGSAVVLRIEPASPA